jgi:imidazolonepropionase-like amidohydrolase
MKNWITKVSRSVGLVFCLLFALLASSIPANGQIAVRGEMVHTMAGEPIRDGIVIIRDGRIAEVGPASSVRVPEGFRTLTARVVTPGLIDARTVVGLSGYLNQAQEQDQLERSQAIQPELRAIDAYNPRERLIEWLRSYGVTTMHTGHAPGALVSGQTMIVKTTGDTVDEAVITPLAMIAASLGEYALAEGGRSPGTRARAMAMLRAELIRAQDYERRRPASSQRPTDAGGGGGARPDRTNESSRRDENTERPAANPTQPEAQPSPLNLERPAENQERRAGDSGGTGQSERQPPERNLRMETLARVIRREIPLLITAHRAHDIMTALRLAQEFNIRIVLDGASESYLVANQIRAANVPVILHATMQRATGDAENLSMETASILRRAGIPVALQSGYEAYVPKTRVVLFEAGIAAANGLSFRDALATITIDAARILGIEQRVGSIERGKDGDLVLFDGDPFEYTTHVTSVLINGRVVSEREQQ